MRKLLGQKNLPYFIAVVQALLFAIVGNQKFTPFPLGIIVGFGVGISINWSMALAASRISKAAKARKPLAYLSLACLMCLSPVVICSTLEWSMSNFSWAVAADLSILLAGSVVGDSLISEDKPHPKPQSEKSGRRAKGKQSQSEIPCRYAGAGCELSGSQNAMNAHARHCKFKPTISSAEFDVSEKHAQKGK
jgi:hypothetical protein